MPPKAGGLDPAKRKKANSVGKRGQVSEVGDVCTVRYRSLMVL